MTLLSEFWSAEDSPGLRRASSETSWNKALSLSELSQASKNSTQCFVHMGKIPNFHSLPGVQLPPRLGLALCHTKDPCPDSGTWASGGNQWEAALKGNWGRGDCRQGDSRECRKTICCPFNTDSLRMLFFPKNRGAFFQNLDLNFPFLTSLMFRY